jgi:RimJ/RimL family protein N-acetyltransferase
VVRPVRPDDLAPLHARRNEPDVQRLQGWALPYPLDRARAVVEQALAMDGPADGAWWMATIAERATASIVGDLVVRLSNDSRTGEVGYSLARAYWGRGYAVEALDALVGWAFESLPLTRLEGRLHPDNRASAMVLERVGFQFEGQVELGPVTPENKAAVLALRTHHSQESFVAPMCQSFADALLPDPIEAGEVEPWLRAVQAEGEVVGFVMVAMPGERRAEPYLWRLLIDRMHQRRGIGTRVLGLLADDLTAAGHSAMLVSWGEGKGSPGRFYLRHGFVPTGRVVDGETEGRRELG